MRSILLSAFLLCCCTARSFAQFIKINEKDVDNNTYTNVNNADVNSTISLELDTSRLLKKINNTGLAGLPSETVTLLDILSQALGKKQEMLTRFRSALQSFNPGESPGSRREKAVRFNASMKQIAGEIVALFDKDPILEQYYAEQPDDSLLMEPIYAALLQRIREVQSSLLASPAYAELKIQLGGWLLHKGNSTPLHFEGLDTNPTSEYAEVERWKFLPSEEQLEELKKLQQLAKTSQASEADFSAILINLYLKNIVQVIADKLQDEIETYKEEAEKILADAVGIEIKATVQAIIADGENFTIVLKDRLHFYENLQKDKDFTLASLLGSIKNDITVITGTEKSLTDQLKKLKGLVAAAAPTIKTKLKKLLVLGEERLTHFAHTVLDGSLFPSLGTDKLADAALVFSDKVFSLSFGQLPADIQADLHYAGAREAGDRLVIRLLLQSGEPAKNIVNETKTINLYMIIPNVQGTVGVIFAHPQQKTAIQKDFQMAPFYNLLFKGLFFKKYKRQSNLLNTLWDVNFGLHVSSPDFNKDDVPELGVGIVASLLDDYVQVGWAYNVFEGVPYYFFGLRLPVPSMNFGNAGHSTVTGK